MDQARESIGFRSFSQLDPRIEYKREGARLFDEMFEHIQERVTDLVFKAKMQVSLPRPSGQQSSQSGEQPKPAAGDTLQEAESKQPKPVLKPKPSEQSIRAASAALSGAKSKGAMTVGRNEPCPCGSGKKYKKCCGSK